MKTHPLSHVFFVLVIIGLLTACATQPTLTQEEPQSSSTIMVDETAMMPLLGYIQQLQRMTPQELLRERSVLMAIPKTPSTRVRLAMLFGQPRGPMDIARALGLLDGVLKSKAPAATSLHPLARVLSTQYSERFKLEIQNEKLNQHIEKLNQQLKESQHLNNELQDKLDALADIEHSLPSRPITSKSHQGIQQ